ncbi:MAG: polyprenyl synthetase family protein [Clostridiales bacterium]|nr:polyprenyl synthetase family protein [Clostridiales bacterium]
MLNYNAEYEKYLKFFSQQLNIALKSFDNIPQNLAEPMTYAIIDGGKRVRPVLLFATAEMLGLSLDDVKEFAIAIESIHSYSLVHDDLPAMDNDDYRRGKFSTHKKFGEAYGILAGDGLLNFAFEYVLSKDNFNMLDAKALKLLAEYAGISGMIAGQVLDLANEKSAVISEQILYSIYENKTAKLLMCPLLISSIKSNGKYYDELKELGLNIGYMFQISDDIMDAEQSSEHIGKTANKDQVQDKLTAIKVFGLEGAKERREYHYNKCLACLDKMQNADFLYQFVKKLYERTK